MLEQLHEPGEHEHKLVAEFVAKAVVQVQIQ